VIKKKFNTECAPEQDTLARISHESVMIDAVRTLMMMNPRKDVKNKRAKETTTSNNNISKISGVKIGVVCAIAWHCKHLFCSASQRKLLLPPIKIMLSHSFI
jgi:hypothetical protein